MRVLMGLVLALLMTLSANGQEPQNKVPGLEITADMTVQAEEGFVIVSAKCDGPVSWTVLGTAPKLKYKIYESEKDVVVGLPGPGHIVSVLCVGVVDGKPTQFARCDITVDGVRPGPTPPPPVEPPPVASGKLPLGTKLWVGIVEDQTKRTPASTAVITSDSIARVMAKQGHTLKIYQVTDKAVTGNAKLADAVNKAGGAPALVIAKYNADGSATIIDQRPLPQSETAFVVYIDGLFAR